MFLVFLTSQLILVLFIYILLLLLLFSSQSLLLYVVYSGCISPPFIFFSLYPFYLCWVGRSGWLHYISSCIAPYLDHFEPNSSVRASYKEPKSVLLNLTIFPPIFLMPTPSPTLTYTVQKKLQFSRYNTKYTAKRDTTRNIPSSISFSPLHFVLYLGKSFTFVTVYTGS